MGLDIFILTVVSYLNLTVITHKYRRPYLSGSVLTKVLVDKNTGLKE